MGIGSRSPDVGAGLRPAPTSAAQWLRAWGPAALWMVLIFALSAVPEIPHHSGLPHARSRQMDDTLRTIGHACEYAVLAVLAWRALVRRRTALAAAAWAAGGSLLYAASDELHQRFVAGRTCSLEDWLVDLVGIVIALGILLALRAFRKRMPMA